jgi:hypothetical protein
MEYPQKTKGASIHLSKETMDALTAMKHWGQSYDGLIKEILFEFNKHRNQEPEKKDTRNA